MGHLNHLTIAMFNDQRVFSYLKCTCPLVSQISSREVHTRLLSICTKNANIPIVSCNFTGNTSDIIWYHLINLVPGLCLKAKSHGFAPPIWDPQMVVSILSHDFSMTTGWRLGTPDGMETSMSHLCRQRRHKISGDQAGRGSARTLRMCVEMLMGGVLPRGNQTKSRPFGGTPWETSVIF